jgi:hypothetical protein
MPQDFRITSEKMIQSLELGYLTQLKEFSNQLEEAFKLFFL